MEFKRLPNNFGSITKLKGKLRKPWMARKYLGVINGQRKYKVVGYYETKNDAFKALQELGDKIITQNNRTLFSVCFDGYLNETYVDNQTLKTTYTWYYNKYVSILGNRKINELTVYDIEQIRDNPEIPRTSHIMVQRVINHTFEYAYRHDLIEVDISKKVIWKIDKSTKKERNMLTMEEVAKFFPVSDYKDCPTVKKFLWVLLYTGMRPIEVIDMKVENISFIDQRMIGGSKTEAGKNRSIPIHPNLVPILADLMAKSKNGRLFPYNNYRCCLDQFKKQLPELFSRFQMYDLRHLFQTRSRECHIDEHVTDVIVGHKSNSLTLDVYTHISWEYILSEFGKFNYDVKPSSKLQRPVREPIELPENQNDCFFLNLMQKQSINQSKLIPWWNAFFCVWKCIPLFCFLFDKWHSDLIYHNCHSKLLFDAIPRNLHPGYHYI